MGVHGLWSVVHPCARPIKIETLNRKRLAVDASIWIYQFLKAVRDKEGSALRNSHVVGFFRRICKLLYLGIKPVFVFDGGAPVLKRQTINSRKRRREGRRDDAAKTAGKLLALQMHRAAEEEEMKRKSRHAVTDEEGDVVPEDVVYADEINMTPQERQKNRKFKKQDQYHLPALDANLAEMGQPNDPRIMSLEELQHYANQFQSGEDINVYDFSKIDFDSAFFTSLPASDRYNILNAARLRSRLRMGYSKEQLDKMFPNRMEFSRFQIDRVRERNELTQRLMAINNTESDLTFGSHGMNRVAGEKGREYVLVRNDGVEGGWALGVVSNEGKKEKPIDVDALDKASDEEIDSDEEDEFEDVPIEGVNRLPRKLISTKPASNLVRRDAGRRRAIYNSRRKRAGKPNKSSEAMATDSLFVQSSSEDEGLDDTMPDAVDEGEDIPMENEDEELQRAIAMSMEQNEIIEDVEDDTNEVEEVFHEQTKAQEARPFAKGSGQSIAHMANARAVKMAPKPILRHESSDDDADDRMDLQAALTESRKNKQKLKAPSLRADQNRAGSPAATAKAAGFDGPLPFEKLNLGASLLGKKKIDKIEKEQAGGFEREDDAPKTKKPEARPLPPWFAGDLDDDMAAQKKLEVEQREADERAAQEELERNEFVFEPKTKIQKHDTLEVIDLEAEPSQNFNSKVIAIESGGESDEEDMFDRRQRPKEPTPLLGDVAEAVRAEPPLADPAQQVDVTEVKDHTLIAHGQSKEAIVQSRQSSVDSHLQWSDSDHEEASRPKVETSTQAPSIDQPFPQPIEADTKQDSDEEEFEDVVIEEHPSRLERKKSIEAVAEVDPEPIVERVSSKQPPERPEPDTSAQELAIAENITMEDEYPFSDPEEEDLLRQLAEEQEEHARFASTLNHRTVQQNIVEYEKELKELRSQQKKDRRDADEVTQTMVTECQQLLGLFGLPYITAPMEAEAQCAELVHLGLVDGIVTDDSDVFLFGGTRVYKNVFNQAKFVECYLTSDLEAEFGLTRKRLISIAQLLGSDYTEGLAGIGPVTALEILSEFDDLTNFNQWWTEVQNGTSTKEADATVPFRKKFRRSHAAKLFLPMRFPDTMVEAAYLEPEVDSDPSEFVWGVPDLNALRAFLMATIGWTNERTDEVLVPVIRDMNRREFEGTQSNITAFFSGNVGAGAFAPRVRGAGSSRRLETALHKIGGRAKGDKGGVEEAQEDSAGASAAAEKTVAKKSKKGAKRILSLEESDEDGVDDDFVEPKKKTRRTTRVKKKQMID